MKVFASLDGDSQQGWVWFYDPSLPPRAVVRIKNSNTSKVIYCEALQIEDNFLREYNQPPRIHITERASSIVLNAWYRARLGGIQTQTEAPLVIVKTFPLWGNFRACTLHPQLAMRVAAWLGLLSVGLGSLGVVLGAMSLCYSG